MNAYSCREIINTENLDRIIKAKRLDTGKLTQLQRLRKRLKEHDGYAHKVNFALNPQTDDNICQFAVIRRRGLTELWRSPRSL